MKALYMYEHNFIPGLLFSNDKGMTDDFYQHLLYNFQSLSLEIIHKFSEEENVPDIVFATAMKDEFKSEQLFNKEVNGVQYSFLKLFFFFQENPDFSPLCPHAYVVLSKDNGKNVYYYFTVEFDSIVKEGNSRGSYWLCRWINNSEGELKHLNYGQIKLDDEIEINEILDKIVKKKVISDVSISDNSKRVSYAPYGWEERERAKREEYKRKKEIEKVEELVSNIFVIGIVFYMIYLFCK